MPNNGDEAKAEKLPSGRVSPATLTINIPSEAEGRGSRSASPAQLSTALVLKVKTQLNRLSCIQRIHQAVPDSPSETSLSDVLQWTAQLEELHKAFAKEHAYFEVTWPAACVDHDYFGNDVFEQETHYVMETKMKLSRLKQALTTQPRAVEAADPQEGRSTSKLPDITLPTFSGEYAQWPAFRELFSSIVLDNNRLSSVEKLHYLRSSMKGAPCQLISTLPLTAASLQLSWDTLIARYENKRLIVQAHLDQLFSLTPVTTRSATSLRKITSTISEVSKSLLSLGMTQDMWDCFLIQFATRNLDRVTREAWETSLGATQDYPRYQQLEAFLESKIRALEHLEAGPSHQTSSSSRRSTASSTSNQASGQSQDASKSAGYQCDWCGGGHYIIMCSKFRDLSVQARRKVITDKRLCYNCCGRHNARACRSTVLCKTCSGRHHTMLHDGSSSVGLAPSASAETSRSAH